MEKKESEQQDQYSPEETEQRLTKIVRAAGRMRPTPFKAIRRKARAPRSKRKTASRK